MNLKQLEAFICVAELGGYSKAAKKMYLTQPTVSAHIFALEKELNVRLFIRNTKEVYLTDNGKRLYKYAKEMVDIEKAIYEEFLENEEEEKNELCIAASTIPAQYLLPQILRNYRVKYPDEHIRIQETDSSQVVSKIVNHEVDLGFTGTKLETKHCKYIPFYKDELVIVTPRNEKYLDIQQKEERLIDWIKKEPFILREEGSGTRKEANKQLKNIGIIMDELEVVAVIENQETIKKSVISGSGISILSKLAVREEEKRKELLVFPIPKAGSGRDINLVYNKNYPIVKNVQRLINIVEGMSWL
ncbi:DNA-binding transcriptional LysR family regulator [Aequitasia blattaphilus]|uniref:Selenium metabolism-associated LysR family transcriptional regulator n=1 Tax=Aequitasia blattaphilus TaxID=2949332 RepID=A0ABT1EAM7_9FIRM|nr:selenium metabolism-associated LysR family transcriptional regulator [Aequitasia blattaphilus]MCP1102889.1 selenium metabolism-associated LysR family transcriptional regulator [Aequitasia blattaphilus]MCR8615529.1 selenium metabolism-associated LysR family transcriptional regulator [Aequitasia blattaphilus]